MKNVPQPPRNREYKITVTAFDSIDDSDIDENGCADADRNVTASNVAKHAVRMLLDGAFPEVYDVDVTDEDGVTWPLVVGRWRKKWACERRDEAPWNGAFDQADAQK